MRRTLEVTRSRALVLLWTFALGTALSYQPPEMMLPAIEVELLPVIEANPWASEVVHLEGWVDAKNVTIHNNLFIGATSYWYTHTLPDGQLVAIRKRGKR